MLRFVFVVLVECFNQKSLVKPGVFTGVAHGGRNVPEVTAFLKMMKEHYLAISRFFSGKVANRDMFGHKYE